MNLFKLDATENHPPITVEVSRYGEIVVRFGESSGYLTPFAAKAFAAAIADRVPTAEQIRRDEP